MDGSEGETALLGDVGKLVEDEHAAFRCTGRILMGSENDVTAHGIRASVDEIRGARGASVRVDAHGGEVESEAFAELSTESRVQLDAGLVDDLAS
jgi:hypothetical protein